VYKLTVWCALLFGSVLSVSAQRSKPRYQLTVTVTDSTQHRALESATVVLREKQRSVLTNTAGLAVFDSVEAGLYTVQVSYVGYHVYERRVDVRESRMLKVELCPEEFHLHEVEITERRVGEYTAVTGQRVEYLNKQQLDALRGQTFAEQLKLIPGITTFSTGPSISKPVIRGLHSMRVLTINGGVRQEGQQWGGEHGPEIDPFLPGSIEVIKGASSVAYGPEAIGGVVRMEPRSFRVAEGVGGEWMGNYFSNNRQAAGSLVFEGHHHHRAHHFSWWVQGSTRKAGDSRAPHYVMSNTGFRETDAAAGAEWRNTSSGIQVYYTRYSTTLGILRGSHVGNKADLLRAIQSPEPFYTSAFTYRLRNPKQEVMHQTGSIKLWHQFKHAGRVSLQVAQQVNSRREFDAHYIYSDSLRALQLPAYELTLTTQTAELRFEHHRWRKLTGNAGVSYMHQGNYAAGERFLIPNFIARTAGVFAIEKWTASRWQAEAGIRYDWRVMDIYRNTNGRVEHTPHSWQNFTAAMGASYHINERLKAEVNVASAWRPPAVNELYSNGLHAGTATFETGNENLLPEQSFNTDVGLHYTRERWNLQVSVYSNYLQNFIFQQPDTQVTVTIRGSFPTWRYTQTDARLTGAELQWLYMPSKHWQVRISGAWLYAQNERMNKPLILMPSNRVMGSVVYVLPTLSKHVKKSEAEWSTQAIARQQRFPAGEDYANPPAGYVIHSISWRNTFCFGKQDVQFRISAHNLFNTAYRDYLSRFRYFTDEPGRNIVFSVQIPFQVYQPKSNK
jgi:iron complex outermembrane receptor protein